MGQPIWNDMVRRVTKPISIHVDTASPTSLVNNDDSAIGGDVNAVLKLTAFLLLLHGGQSWHLDIPFRFFCGMALVVSSLRWSWRFWLIVLGLTVLSNRLFWYSIDNHKYLITYWLLCVVIALANIEVADRILRTNARLLIGLCFGFAVAWKIMGGQYSDGSFLKYTLLLDSRAEVMTTLFCDIELRDLRANRSLVSLLTRYPEEGLGMTLCSNSSVDRLATCLSWWTLAIELIIASQFLLCSRPGWLANGSLLVFVSTTYFVFPVVGFGSILALLGFVANLEGKDCRVWKYAYLTLFFVIQLASLPWNDFVAV